MNWPTPKFLILTQNNQFSKRKLFLHPFERTTHLLHSVGPPTKEISTQKILTLTRKNEKKKKKNHVHLKEPIFCLIKVFFILT